MPFCSVLQTFVPILGSFVQNSDPWNCDVIVLTVKAQTINISPLCGDYAPEPIDTPFMVSTPVRDIIIPVKFYVDSLTGV